jgi:hypothetical protein
MEMLKQAQADTDLFVNGGLIQFVKSPTPTRMIEVFKSLISPTGRFYLVCFSDDMCLSIRTETGINYYNVDISSCDGSHGPIVFETFRQLVPDDCKDAMDSLMTQCTLPIAIRDYANPKNKVVLQPRRRMLYSGSTITTAINTFASMMIAVAFSRAKDTSMSELQQAARAAGYIVTMEPCKIWQQLQFLKHSPVIDVDGHLRSVLNLGVLLRLSGQCVADLPGKGPWEERAKRFQYSLLQGAYPRAHFELVDLMKDQSRVEGRLDNVERYIIHKVVGEQEAYTLSNVELYKRYELDEEEELMVADFARSGVGYVTANRGLAKILQRDYGMGCYHGVDKTRDDPREFQ